MWSTNGIAYSGGINREIGMKLLQTFCLASLSLILTTPAAAERVNICNFHTFSQASGSTCSFYAQPGDLIKVWARYRDTSPHNANVTLAPYGTAISVPANQERILTKRISDTQAGTAIVQYNIPGYSSGDFLDLEVYTLRSNLRVGVPSINSGTGELRVPWSVSSNEPFVPVNYVDVALWGTQGHGSYNQLIGAWNLNPCVGQANCSRTIVQSLTQRNPISRGLSNIEVAIDSGQAHIELDESDNDNHKSIYLDNFFSESIPNIMRARASNWDLAGELLDRWLDNPVRRKNTTINGIDWALEEVYPAFVNSSWFIDPANASNSRIINAYNWLRNPSNFNTPATRDVLKDNLDDRFDLHPGSSTLAISAQWLPGRNIRNYHKQHIQYKQGQLGSGHLDAVTAAFGRFSMYLVPRGTVVRHSNRYAVTIDSVAIHVMDSFDFNGSQLLGCWKAPNQVSLFPGNGFECVGNSDFRYYRNVKARGWDYNVFIPPFVTQLATPISFNIPR